MPTAARTGPRVGLLGGSFDPPHLAHLALGQAAMAQLGLTELRWLPAGAPWQKADRLAQMAAPEQRLAMLGLLLGDDAAARGQVIDDRELRRDGATYTIDTIRELQAERPEVPAEDWLLVLGQDQYARFHTWRDWPELLQRLTLAVAARGGQPPQPSPELAALPHRVRHIDLPPLDISASDIRRRAATGAAAHSLAPLVGEAVAGYIARHGLYHSFSHPTAQG
ncbi:MAG: nicotinate (nicotinamide) nucleotide adenylyltransferase [Burkholderiaceae bacterium]|nr:nicotinate (nicotinamide) nucleotide adenylyltransferase [Burkholderiaceae bacterium]